MNKARCGENTAKQYTRFYLLLLKADPNGATVTSPKKETKLPIQSTKKPEKKIVLQSFASPANEIEPKQEAVHSDTHSGARHPRTFNTSPELHINIQLHISPESSADQIDKIFESMAKHLKTFSR
jgi:hypothetical protein